jgi:DNA-binding XRE family transcriptional regulator
MQDAYVQKPKLIMLRRKHGLHQNQLATAAGVSLGIEYAAEVGGWVSYEDAMKLLSALSRLTGISYTPHNVAINLREQFHIREG